MVGDLSPTDFLHIVQHTPLVSIDLVLLDPAGRVLVGLRKNNPARNWWFVPGGRIRKDEAMKDACRRISERELGITLEKADGEMLGAYDHFYPDNALQQPGVTTHYVCLAFRFRLQNAQMNAIKPDNQHGSFRWLATDQLLADPNVHLNTKRYFA
ncbi:MAG: colanic acid biosynthesis protein WcaH [Puniceicoccaceae bacterium 5H]|nr:MAG: colanic acid biosynthesis protein WcaH [Puniceicoccaceae bacterium 5H]